jgi:ketosteroid isomerase-like protein
VTSRVIHQNAILGKHVTPDAVILEMEYDVTPHDTKQRQQWREAAVYRVTGGKISEVRFYYKPPVAS